MLTSHGIEGPWCARWSFALGKDEGINELYDYFQSTGPRVYDSRKTFAEFLAFWISVVEK